MGITTYQDFEAQPYRYEQMGGPKPTSNNAVLPLDLVSFSQSPFTTIVFETQSGRHIYIKSIIMENYWSFFTETHPENIHLVLGS